MCKMLTGWTLLWLGLMRAYPNDPLQQPVHYDQPARTVKQLLADLSHQTGVTLFAPSPIDTEIVLVSVQKMPLQQLMEHLAWVTDGEWFKQPNGSYHLVRTPKLVRERREQDDVRLSVGLQRYLAHEMLKSMVEPLTEQQVRDHCEKIKSLMQEIEAQNLSGLSLWRHPQSYRLYHQMRQLNAGERLFVRLVRQLNLRRLLEIPVGERRVFSNRQGRYLLPFGFSVESLLKQYQREAELVYQVWTHPIYGIEAEREGQLVGGSFPYHQKPPESPLTRLYLVVSRRSPDTFAFSAVLLSEDLKQSVRVHRYGWYIRSQEELGEKSSESSQGDAPSEASPPPVIRIEWSELSRQFLEAYRAVERGREPTSFPEVLDPAKVEPLSLVPTDVLRTHARQRGKSLVALVPESLVEWLAHATKGFDTLQDYQQRFRWSFEMQEGENVLLFKPRWSSYQWGLRLNRKAMSHRLQQMRQRGYPKLQDYLDLLKICQQSNDYLFRFYQDLLLPEDEIPLHDWNNGFLNSLSQAQLDRLRAGGQLALSELPPKQREQLLRDIYFGNTSLSMASSESDNSPARLEASELLMNADLPHIFYPNGLPSGITIRLAQHDNESLGIFTTHRAGIWGGFRWMMSFLFEAIHSPHEGGEPDPDDYARYVQERVDRYKAAQFLPVRRRVFRLEIQLANGHAVYFPSRDTSDLEDYELFHEGKPVTLDTLPGELKTELEKWLGLLKRRHPSGSEDGY
jgi:hypothetical protein